MTKQNASLASARAYWRLAKRRDISDRQREAYENIAERKYQQYLDGKKFVERLKQRDAEARRRREENR